MPKIDEFRHFISFTAETFYKKNFSLRPLRLCGDLKLQAFVT